MAFKLEKLLTDVFRPEAGEVVTVACDLPRPGIEDTAGWAGRRQIARVARGFQCSGHAWFTSTHRYYPADGLHNRSSEGPCSATARWTSRWRCRLHAGGVPTEFSPRPLSACAWQEIPGPRR